jgi:hypothetical protein
MHGCETQVGNKDPIQGDASGRLKTHSHDVVRLCTTARKGVQKPHNSDGDFSHYVFHGLLAWKVDDRDRKSFTTPSEMVIRTKGDAQALEDPLVPVEPCNSI